MTSASNDNGGETAPEDIGKRAPCPICNAPHTAQYAPFCSKRCADVDLHRWLSGAYAIPAVEGDDDGALPDDDEPPEAS